MIAGTSDQLKISKICESDFYKKWAKVHTSQTPYLRQMGGDPPRTETIFIRVRRTKICKGQVGTKAPRGGELDKVPHPQNFRSPFSRKIVPQHIQNFRDERGSQTLSTAGAIFTFNVWELCDNKNHKFSLWGALPPNLTP